MYFLHRKGGNYLMALWIPDDFDATFFFCDVDHDVLPDDFYICSSSPNLSSQLQTHVFACLLRQDTEALYAPQGPPKTRHLTLPNLLLYLLPQLKAFPSNLLVKLKAPQETVKRKASHRRGGTISAKHIPDKE